jgi:hypothetical protein
MSDEGYEGPDDYEPPDYEPPDYEPPEYEPPEYEPPDDQGPDDYEPPEDQGPDDYDPDAYADYVPDPDDYEPGEPSEDDEDALVQQYEAQIKADAVEEFNSERLKSYFKANPKVALPAFAALHEAQSFLAANPKVALVFSTTAMEIALKAVMLRPIVFGLVHTEGLAGFITEVATDGTGMDRFKKLLTGILATYAEVNLDSYKRTNSKVTLWQEFTDVQKARNMVIHRGEKVPDSMAHIGVAVAATLLTRIFPALLKKLGLTLNQRNEVE